LSYFVDCLWAAENFRNLAGVVVVFCCYWGSKEVLFQVSFILIFYCLLLSFILTSAILFTVAWDHQLVFSITAVPHFFTFAQELDSVFLNPVKLKVH